MGLRGFERRLERLVEGSFSKAFRSGLQPVEIGHRMTRLLDERRAVGVDGRRVGPNNFGVYLSDTDFNRFQGFAEALARELAEVVRDHARAEKYQFLGPITVTLVPDPSLREGDLEVTAEIHEGAAGRVGTVVLADGSRVTLGEQTTVIGRTSECSIAIADTQVSRRHAEIRPSGTGYELADVGSTNGTLVNGTRVQHHQLVDGDRITVGSTTLRFEAS